MRSGAESRTLWGNATRRLARAEGKMMIGTHAGDGRRVAPLAGQWTWMYMGASALVVLPFVGGLESGVGPLLVIVTGCGLVGLSLVRSGPGVKWPWWLLVVAVGLWGVAAVAREATGATGDLSASRSLLPDVFAVPGYLALVAAVVGLLNARRLVRDPGLALDAAMLALGAATLSWAFLVVPLLERDAAPVAKVSISLYLPISACLVALAARLAFAPGIRSVAYRLVLGAMVAMFVGDLTYLLVETHVVEPPANLRDLPYLVGVTLGAGALTHPSFRRLVSPAPRRRGGTGTLRIALLATALLVPVVVLLPGGSLSHRLVSGVLGVTLTTVAIVRLLLALRDQAGSEARLAHQATHDALTGLPNRTLVLEHIDGLLVRALTTGREVALLFIDIDQFKLINDSMGHPLGDDLLIVAADRLRGTVGRDHMVGRMSGDEFVVVADGLNSLAAHAMAERVRRSFAEPFALPAGEVFASASIGVAVAAGGHGLDATTLIRDADTAMYAAKAAGRNTVSVFDTDMRDRVARRVTLERALRGAIDDGRLTVHYQPIVSLPLGRVLGFEALVRWREGDGMMPTGEFVAVAEDTGLIVPMGAWVLDQACGDIARWRAELPGAALLYVSVNLSPRQVRESDVIDTVADCLAAHDLPGQALSLEITENVMLEDTLGTAAVLSGLRELGVSLAIDDFGTGFSSLAYLKRFAVGRLKIDRAFVSGIGRDRSDESLVEAVVALAGAFGMGTVAEGVETHEQAARLVDLGCYEAQGYYFSRPVPVDQVPDVLRRLGSATQAPWFGRAG